MCTNGFYIVHVLDLYIRNFYGSDFNMMLKIFYLVIMVKASFLTYLYIYVSAL